jgi:hypothetical protein
MRFAGKHFAYHQAFESAFDRLYLFDTPSLQTDRGQGVSYFFGLHIEIEIFFQPVV